MNKKIFVILFLVVFNGLRAQNIQHPRIYINNDNKISFIKSINAIQWKKQIVEDKKNNLKKYLKLCEKDSNWLVSRLQMNWITKHNKVFLRGGKFSHSEGEAPIPTVRFNGSRDLSTDYELPDIESVVPFLDNENGLIYLKNLKTGKKEWVHPSKTGFIIDEINTKIMQLVQDAAFLYWLTGEEKYATFAAPVFFTYMHGMYYRDAPIDLDNTKQQRLSGLATFEVIHEQIAVLLAVSYDFLQPYFFDKNYNLDKTAAVFQKWGDQIINNGVAENNWNLFQARILTYIALALDKNETYINAKGQEYFLDHIFKISTERQIALEESLLEYDYETAIWPESSSYSLMVTSSLLEIVTLLDNVTNKNELSNYPILEKVVLASFQYLFPSGYTVAFGDAHHSVIPPEIFELLISNYHKYNQKVKEEEMALILNQMIENKQYIRTGDDYFNLFFYVDSLTQVSNKSIQEVTNTLRTPTFYAPNVSLFIQRMGVEDKAMMVATSGSFGNHSHANGISIELFANKWVLGPDMANVTSYWHPDYQNYYSRFPAHNTVVVDGISNYDAMEGYHPFSLNNYFPKTGFNTTIFDKITFSNVSFVEPKTVSNQQRLTAQIKSEHGNGYIIDVFRSRKKIPTTQKHEYFYHNIGQSLQILDSTNQVLKLKPTDDLGSHRGDLKAYDYLKDKKSISTSENVKALFSLKSDGQPENIMKAWVKGIENQTIYSVKAPKSGALSEGTAPKEVLDKEIPTLIIKKEGEAWVNPFVVVFNPYIEGAENPIKNIIFSDVPNYPETQQIEVIQNDNATKDYIIANVSENDIASNNKQYLKGLLSVIRTSTDENIPKFIFVAGAYRFIYNNWEIRAKNEAVTVSIEHSDNQLKMQTDGPVVIKIPINEGFNPQIMEIYENGTCISKRNGFISRLNPNQIEFRLERAFEKAIVFLK